MGNIYEFFQNPSTKIAIGTMEALGIAGVIGMGVQYLRGGWPFAELSEYGWYLRENILGGVTGPLEGKGTRFHFSPFKRFILDDDNPKVITKSLREIEIPEYRFLTKENYGGVLRLEFKWKIPNAKGANKFYFDNEQGNSDLVDNKIFESVGIAIGNSEGKNLKTNLLPISEFVKGYSNNLSIENSIASQCGVRLESLSLSQIKWDPNVEEILLAKEKAEADKRAMLIRGDATAEATNKYIEIAKKLLGEGHPEIGQYAFKLMEMDNREAIAKNPNITTIVSGGMQPPLIVSQRSQQDSEERVEDAGYLEKTLTG